MVAVIVLLIVGIWAAWRILDASQPFPTPNAAPAPALDPQMPVRARTAPPALRVHLCTECLCASVPAPGERCYPYCVHPVHEAERILRETKGGVA
jgi:hypothetical protein